MFKVQDTLDKFLACTLKTALFALLVIPFLSTFYDYTAAWKHYITTWDSLIRALEDFYILSLIIFMLGALLYAFKHKPHRFTR